MTGSSSDRATSVPGTHLALAARGVTKHFPGVLANDRVDLEVLPGEVHALLGENGSGKTTLCKILTGLYRPDAGEVIVDGARVTFSSPADAYAAGVFMVHQHFSLVHRMTVAENVVLGWSRRRGLWFDRRAVEDEVAAAAEEFGIHVDPRAHVWQLSVGERQRVEILKALYRGARTLILDEPTTVLTPQEAEHLFQSLRRIVDNGGAVVFISHKLNEVLRVCDRVTVLQHGRNAGRISLREGGDAVDTRALARMMVGREIQLTRRTVGTPREDRGPVLRIRDLYVHNDFDRPVVKGVTLDVHAGEIVGIAGVAGNGQRELAEAICGLRPRASGEVSLDDRLLRSGDARETVRRGLAFVPEDRMGVGLAPGLKVSENLVLKAVDAKPFHAGPFVRMGRVRERTEELLKRFDVRGTADTLVRQLSGGNAQKVLLARELSSSPKALVIAAPTRGLDVAAMEAVRRLLGDAAQAGVAVMMVSEDLDEILDLADRVAVMCDGHITGVLDAREANLEEVGLLMMGQEGTAAA
ncbi:MAG: ABC transporter ATP-binding protein [Solirubrobacteraceae bacterium]